MMMARFIIITFHHWLSHWKCSIGFDATLSPCDPFITLDLQASPPHHSLDPFLFFGISMDTSSHIGPSDFALWWSLGVSTFASFAHLVWVFCQSHSWSLGGETSCGRVRVNAVVSAVHGWFFDSWGSGSSRANVNPLVLCLITKAVADIVGTVV
jgi:hypothetical protein